MTIASKTPQPIVEIHDVWKSFGTTEVLKGISMGIHQGDVVCLIGPSGSGKSTLLRCINALVGIDRGAIVIDGLHVHDPGIDSEIGRETCRERACQSV